MVLIISIKLSWQRICLQGKEAENVEQVYTKQSFFFSLKTSSKMVRKLSGVILVLCRITLGNKLDKRENTVSKTVVTLYLNPLPQRV